ncbi:hypothetical protein F4778DRAFT_354820 [Xylariomycetidae sp. FL2044]|nr:hypothetical protein F4778DRAFT_354820 [Xylariomycetidae sp. FL2044]
MASTREARFDYKCQNREFSYTVALPASLFSASGDPVLFAQKVTPIVVARKDECVASSNPLCSMCRTRPTTSVLQTPMSWLHRPWDPSIAVHVRSVCRRVECDRQGRREIEDMINEVTAEFLGRGGGFGLGVSTDRD